jgi:hypothetical protein
MDKELIKQIADEVENRIITKMKKALQHWLYPPAINYRAIPSAPFSSGYNRVQAGLAVAGQLRLVDIGNPAGGIDVVLSGAFTDGLTIVDLLGSAGVPFRIVGTGPIGSDSKGFAIGTVSGCDYIEIYGPSAASPMVITANGANMHALQMAARSGGTSFKLQNAVMKSPGSSGMLLNSSSNTYRNIIGNNIRMFNAYREFGYFGSTSTPFATFDSISLEDIVGYNTEWDFIQASHCDDLYINRATFKNGGTTDTNQQDHAIQNTDANGLVENCIFDNVPRFCNIFSHGMTYRNCYFRFTDAVEYPGFMGRTDNLSYYGSSPRFNGLPVKFDGCYFDDDTGVVGGALVNVQERISNREFVDCSFDTLRTSLYNDSRAVGHSNSLIGTLTTNGNSINTLTAPTFSNFDEDDYQNHGLCTSRWFTDRGMGNRS